MIVGMNRKFAGSYWLPKFHEGILEIRYLGTGMTQLFADGIWSNIAVSSSNAAP